MKSSSQMKCAIIVKPQTDSNHEVRINAKMTMLSNILECLNKVCVSSKNSGPGLILVMKIHGVLSFLFMLMIMILN